MTLLNVERIKLFSTRSPYWCLAAIAAAALGFATLFGLVENGEAAIPYLLLRGVGLGMSIFMVLAALAVTTEYRFSTIRNTFLGVPRRPLVLLAKTVLLAVLGAVVGLIAAVASYFLAKALAQDPPVPLELSTWDDWRQVVGYGAIFGIAAVIAVSVGTIVRQSAGAIAILLLWPLILEGLFGLIPTVGEKVGPWLPFTASDKIVAPSTGISNLFQPTAGPDALQGLLVVGGTAAALWIVALVLLQKRDA
jgi:ABC-2 type transport system permease protein